MWMLSRQTDVLHPAQQTGHFGGELWKCGYGQEVSKLVS